MRRIALLIALTALLSPSAALASQGAAFTQTQAVGAPASSQILVGVGNLHTQDNCSNLPYGQFVRVIEGWQEADPSASLECAQAAHDAGHPVELVIQWPNTMAIPQIQARVAVALAAYQSIHPFAVALGNEQEFSMTGGVSITPAQYAAEFRATVGMVKRAMPKAIRVAGEVSPWGNGFMHKAADAGLPGAQAYAEHVYPSDLKPAWIMDPFLAVTHKYHVMAFADEGVCGPDAWMKYSCLPVSALRKAGYSLAAEWYIDPSSTPSSPISY